MLSSRYSRQTVLPFVGERGQARLRTARVGVLGCGALGTVVAELLTRAGVGYLRIIDRDIVELSNLQRQTLFTEQDAEQRLPKAMAAQQRLGQINSEVCVDAVVTDYAWHNALILLSELDLVVDATDNYLTRLTLNDACLELRIPWVYGGALGTLGMSANFLPLGPCFRCLVRDLPAPGVGESCDVSGVFGPVTAVVGAIQAAEAIKVIISPTMGRTDLVEVDLLKGDFRTLPLQKDVTCPACQLGKRDFLRQESHQSASLICGRDSVMLQQSLTDLDLCATAERLKARGQSVRVNKFRLQVEIPRFELILFSDGRALVNGTNDTATAKRVYNEILG